MPWLVDEPQMFIRPIWLGGFPLRARELAGVASTMGIYLGRGFSSLGDIGGPHPRSGAVIVWAP